MGAPGVVPVGREPPASRGCRRSAGLLQCNRTVVGQPGLRLGRPRRYRIRLVDSSGSAPCWPRWTWFAWIISGHLPPPGMYLPEHRPRRPANGCRGPERGSSTRFRPNLARCRSLRKIWESSLPMWSELREQFQIPSTRVLQFAFDGDPDNMHLPENCASNTVVYTGTHDNATTREWFQSLPERDRRHLLGIPAAAGRRVSRCGAPTDPTGLGVAGRSSRLRPSRTC